MCMRAHRGWVSSKRVLPTVSCVLPAESACRRGRSGFSSGDRKTRIYGSLNSFGGGRFASFRLLRSSRGLGFGHAWFWLLIALIVCARGTYCWFGCEICCVRGVCDQVPIGGHPRQVFFLCCGLPGGVLMAWGENCGTGVVGNDRIGGFLRLCLLL